MWPGNGILGTRTDGRTPRRARLGPGRLGGQRRSAQSSYKQNVASKSCHAAESEATSLQVLGATSIPLLFRTATISSVHRLTGLCAGLP
eukprot:3617599-Pyramimonas_sp.AAC.1